ncbi:MAG: hypothetical protein ABI877_18275 [Gemmatimonadaceae bacterium]
MLAKLLLMSILIATVALPLLAAHDPVPRRALRRVVVWLAAFNVCYLLAILYVLPRVS